MIDPSFDTQSVETVPPFPPTMQELERKVLDLESKVADLEHDRDYWRSQSNNRQAQIDALEMYVKENFDYIDEDVSQNLVEIFSLEITKDYDVTVTVTFSGTVSVPLNYDMDNLENDLSASLESHYYSADIEADFSEDRMEIDWSES
jgi:outer membrane murein-binding lipoprotein Lpp